MGVVFVPSRADVILTDTDRLVARNADGGLATTASHVILLGESAGRNDQASNILALGAFAGGGNGAGISDLNGAGSVFYGVNAGAKIATFAAGTNRPVVIIGYNAAANATEIPGCVIIGAEALSSLTNAGAGSTRGDVIIGDGAARYALDTGGTGIDQCVLIGFNAASGFAPAGKMSIIGVVAIGAGAMQNYAPGAGGSVTQSVFLGSNVANQITDANNNVFIGFNSCFFAGSQSNDNVVIGAASRVVGSNVSRNVLLGSGAGQTQSAQTDSVFIGYNVDGSSSRGGIRLGSGCGQGESAATDDRFIVETVIGGTRRGVLYGDLNAGNLLVGKSNPAVANERTLPGTNILKLLDGTATGTPVSGGFFYGATGELNWRSTAGVDYLLTPHASRGVFTVATLPNTALVAGQRAYVSDALAPAFAAAVVGGGGVFTPVYWDGAAWLCG